VESVGEVKSQCRHDDENEDDCGSGHDRSMALLT
jgi:hypothetical protein